MTSKSVVHTLRRVCVFCGSNVGIDDTYKQTAEELGREIARRGWELVYGGGSVGLMGALADAVLAEGFIKPQHRDLIVSAETATHLLDLLVQHEMPRVKKWINRSDV